MLELGRGSWDQLTRLGREQRPDRRPLRRLAEQAVAGAGAGAGESTLCPVCRDGVAVRIPRADADDRAGCTSALPLFSVLRQRWSD